MKNKIIRLAVAIAIGVFTMGLFGCSTTGESSSPKSTCDLSPTATIDLPTQVEFHGVSFSIPEDWSYEPYLWYLVKCQPGGQNVTSANPELDGLKISLNFFDRKVPTNVKNIMSECSFGTHEDIVDLGSFADIGFDNEVYSYQSLMSGSSWSADISGNIWSATISIYVYVGNDAAFEISVRSKEDSISQDQINLAYCVFQSIQINTDTFMSFIHDSDAKGISDSDSSSKSASSNSSASSSGSSSNASPIVSQQNAVKKAKSYLNSSSFSFNGLIEQLEYEGFPHADAVYGAEHCGADWMVQAEKKAASYMKHSAFSRKGLIDQLEYEGFTPEQAAHGADSVGL